MSSPRLNSVARRAQREMVTARQRAIAQSLGQRIRCDDCGAEQIASMATCRGVSVRDRVQIEAVWFACDQCGADIALSLGD